MRLLTQEDTVLTGCSRGGHCCFNVHVPLTAFDVLRLARFLGETTTSVLSSRAVITEEGGVEIEGEPACPFLHDNQCSVYDARPDACRMYPFWQIPSGEHQWLVERHTCAGCWQECRSVRSTGGEMLAAAGVSAGQEAEAIFQGAIRHLERAGAADETIESFMAEIYDSDSGSLRDSVPRRRLESKRTSEQTSEQTSGLAGAAARPPESFDSEDCLRRFRTLVDRLLTHYLES